MHKTMIVLLKKLTVLLGTSTFLIMSGASYANPTGGSVAAGSIVIQQSPSTTTIYQSSRQGIINWNSFNIKAGEATRFNQPANGITLNRISPLQGASEIYGQLTATGRIILINPAGIYFGPNSFVNVGGLIATTANILDKDFLAGNYHFVQNPAYNGSIVNQGTIIAANSGVVALLGTAVQNDGSIQANLGTAALGAGRDFSISFNGNNNISFAVNAEALSAGVDKNGRTLTSGVSNMGRIVANGGQVIVNAQTARNVLDNAINMRGYVEAKSASSLPGGGVVLGSNGTIRVASNINASAQNQVGGNVTIEAPNIIIENPTTINVSGDLGGGKITIGRTAENTYVQPGVNLLARSFVSGTGGEIETSGHQLTIDGVNVDTRAADGSAGTWLLDPTDITINSTMAATIMSQLSTSNVVVQTADTGTGNGDILTNSSITWSSPFSLTLSAFRNILINTGVTVGGSNSNSSLKIIANNTGNFGFGASGILTQLGTINSAGPVDIYYNAAGAAYNPRVYTNSGSGLLSGYMYINNSGNYNTVRNTSSLWGRNFALSGNITLNSITGLTPLGNVTTNFTGKFDGMGHYLAYANINQSANNSGLFGVTSTAAIIKNLVLYNFTITGVTNVGQLVGNNNGTIDNVYAINGKVTATGNNVGGLVGIQNAGAITNVGNLGVIIAPTATSVGGIVGRINAGSLSKALSVGLVQNSTANSGGLVGINAGTVSSSFWNTDTTGKSNAVGSNTGTVSATGGCFSGTCTNGGTVNLSTSAPFTSAGWDFTNVWGVNPGISYPYPRSYFTTTPQVTSGNVGQFTAYYTNPAWSAMSDSVKNPIWSSFTKLPLANITVNMFIVTLADTSYTNADGSFYFMHTPGFFGSGSFLLALGNSTNKGNTLSVQPPDFTSVTNIPIALNNLIVAGNGRSNSTYLGVPYLAINSTTLISNVNTNNFVNDMLYSVSGDNISLKNGYSMVTGPDVYFRLRSGSISLTNGAFTSLGVFSLDPLTLGTGTMALTTNTAGNIYLNHTYWLANTTTPNQYVFNLTSANNIYLAGEMFGSERTTAGDLISAGTLNISAAYTNQSITTSPSTLIQLFNLNLVKGKWYQSGVTTFRSPAITYNMLISNSFSINSGIMPTSQAQFIRVGGGTGTLLDPYLVVDEYGLQGIGSDNYTLGASWKISPVQGFASNKTIRWNGGAGLVPIGSLAQPFTGTFDGNNDTHLFALSVVRPSENYVGIFGVTSPTAKISNLRLNSILIQGNNNVGLVGLNQGTIENVTIMQSFIFGNNNVGVFAGTNQGTISNVSTFSNRQIGNAFVGGVAGINSGTISNAIIANYIGGNAVVGGLAGLNTGLIKNSFWDTDVTGQSHSTGTNTGTLNRVYGGCLTGPICSNGGLVNLSNARTYKTLLSGGYGLVSQNWDLTNTWSIIPGYSYPFLKNQFDVDARVISGRLSPTDPNELLALFTTLRGNRFSVTIANALDAVITGADGSFYDLLYLDDNKVVVIAATGGNITGSIGFTTPSSFINNGSVRNLNITTTTNSNPPGNNQALHFEEVVGLFAGFSLDQVNEQLNPFTTNGTFRFLVSGLVSYSSQLSDFFASNEISSLNYYYIYNGGNPIKVYRNVDENIRDIMSQAKAQDRRFLDRYDINRITSPYCKI